MGFFLSEILTKGEQGKRNEELDNGSDREKGLHNHNNSIN
jgi:hypothetical protein